jgi:hypothetical protein
MNYSQFLFYLGGTTDIVVQEKLKDGKLKYLCKSSGEKCGGTNVDEELLQIGLTITKRCLNILKR